MLTCIYVRHVGSYHATTFWSSNAIFVLQTPSNFCAKRYVGKRNPAVDTSAIENAVM